MTRRARTRLKAFSYSISHDLRAPLLAIDGFSQILAADCVDKLDAEGLRLLSVIRQNTQAMGQMINDMLAFFRLGRQEMQLTEVDLSDLARTIAEELRSSNAERKLQFKIQPLPRVRGGRRNDAPGFSESPIQCSQVYNSKGRCCD